MNSRAGFWMVVGVCLSVSAGAQSNVTLLVKTDMSCKWKLDGRAMGLLTAENPTVVLVSPGEHVVEASSTVGQAKVRTKVTVKQVEKTVALELKHPGNQKSDLPVEAPRESVADAAKDPTWTDPTTGLMWTGRDNGSDVDWPQANSYCSKLEFAGYRDWRLPTPAELQALYDPNLSDDQVFNEGRNVKVHVKGNLKLTGWTWTGLQGPNPGQPYQSAWLIHFDLLPPASGAGQPVENFLHYSWEMRALCVRSAAHS